jgi:Holliday junction DNA helicase RuvA
MICQIRGKVSQKKDTSLIMEVNGLCYEIFIPAAIMQHIEKGIEPDGSLRLITYHYHRVDPSRSIPVLIGFLNEIEKEFFEQFITVSGIGPKAATKAMTLPFSTIAEAIDQENLSLLKTLPGIGEQKARQIIAKLQGKVGKFCLLQDKAAKKPEVKSDILAEALEVLLQLQYKKKEAEEMITKAMEKNSSAATCEEILNEVYRQKKGKS